MKEYTVGRFRVIANGINRVLLPTGFQLTKLQPEYGSLEPYSEESRPDPPAYVNIGAGGFYHPFWHNLDKPNQYYAASQRSGVHINYDLTSLSPMPFADGTVKVFYSSHVVEHVSDEDIKRLFREVYRSLRIGGTFRVTCPDMDLEYEAFVRGDRAFWKWPNPYGKFSDTYEQRFLEHFATVLTQKHPDGTVPKVADDEIRRRFREMPKEEAFDSFIRQIPVGISERYPGDHVNWFNSDKLATMLRDAGFVNVYESRYGQSRCAVMRNTLLFDTTVPELSVYVECSK